MTSREMALSRPTFGPWLYSAAVQALSEGYAWK